MSAHKISYQVDGYSVEVYGADKKGKRTRWGDRIITIFSAGKNVGQAVFASEGEETHDSYFAEGKIYYFAPGSQYQDVLNLLKSDVSLHFVWRPVYDPKESGDGDAFFSTNVVSRP